MADKGKKGKNITQYEKTFLLDLVLNKKDVIENKKTDAQTNDSKNIAWETVTALYNSGCQTGERTMKQLKELYGVIKRNSKKALAADRVSLCVNISKYLN